jgi:RNA polymerase sigma-70 factor (ECF subfamily)
MSTLDPAAAINLVERIAGGEARAESELVERCGQTLRFLARRFARSAADAEDLYQETLILALQKIRRREVKQPEHLAAFLRALAKNLSIQRYRRRSYAVEVASDEPPDAPQEGQPSPLSGLLDQERIRLTRRLLSELTVARDREVLFRYYLAEESHRQICADLDLESEHFYRVLHRARQRYKRLWEERGDGTTEPGERREPWNIR